MTSPIAPGYARSTADGSEIDVWVVPGARSRLTVRRKVFVLAGVSPSQISARLGL